MIAMLRLIFYSLIVFVSIPAVNAQRNDSSARASQLCIRVNDALFSHINQSNDKDSTVNSNASYTLSFYRQVGKNFSLGGGSGIERSRYYFDQIKKHDKVLQMPLYMSLRISTDNQFVSLIEEAGILVPVQSNYALGTGAYLLTGFQIGYKSLRMELSYKILSAPQTQGKTLFINNLNIGLFLTLLSN